MFQINSEIFDNFRLSDLLNDMHVNDLKRQQYANENENERLKVCATEDYNYRIIGVKVYHWNIREETLKENPFNLRNFFFLNKF